MSGKRQHFIPQVLQRGFASHEAGESVFTWVFRKERQPFNTNILNSGVEGRFYSGTEDITLDDDITQFEGLFSSAIVDMQSGPTRRVDNADLLAQLLAHLELRTRHLRKNVSNTARRIISELQGFSRNEPAFEDYLRRKMSADPSQFRTPIAEELRRRGFPEILISKYMSRIGELLEHAIVATRAERRAGTEAMLARELATVDKGASAGQRRALTSTLAPPIKVDVYSTLHYNLFELPDMSIPLGDSAVLFQVEGPKPFRPFFEKGDELIAVILPVSSHHVLIGRPCSEVAIPSDLTTHISRCSLEYFIAEKASREIASLQPEIGLSAQILTQIEIQALLSESGMY